MGNIAKGAQFEVEIVHLPQGKQRVTRTACGGSAMTKAPRRRTPHGSSCKFLAGEDFQWLMAKVGGHHLPGAQEGRRVAGPLRRPAQFAKSPRVTVDAMAYARIEPYVRRATSTSRPRWSKNWTPSGAANPP